MKILIYIIAFLFGFNILFSQGLEAPTLIYPFNDSFAIDNITFEWSYVTNANNYSIQISTDSLFSENIIYNDSDFTCTYYNTLIQPDWYSIYYWHVRATNDTSQSSWSEIWTITSYPNYYDTWTYPIRRCNDIYYQSYIIIPDYINPRIGSRTFSYGDAVGAFYPDSSGQLYCDYYSVWSNSTLTLNIYSNNENSNSINGYRVGQRYLLKIWDGSVSSGGTEYFAAVKYDYGPDNFQTDGFSIVDSLSAVMNPQTRNIILNQGWNAISSNILPFDQNIESLLAGIRNNMVIIKDGSGNYYVPGYGIDNLNYWDYYKGFQIYMSAADTLSITGDTLNPSNTSINLSQGWNVISYLRDSAMSVSSALAGIDSLIVVVKDGSGNFYVPSYNINTIGDMLPGKAYWVYMSGAGVLVYPGNN